MSEIGTEEMIGLRQQMVGLLRQGGRSRPSARAPPLASRPEELHLRALPEPCVTLSSHTSPDVRPLRERLCLVHWLIPFPVGQWPRPNTQPLRSSPITGPSTLLRVAPPLRPASVLSPSRLEPLAACPFTPAV